MFAAGNQQPPHPHHAFDLALHEDYPRLRQLQQASTAGDRTRGGLVSGIDDEEEDDDNDDYYDILSAGGMSAADRPSQQLKQKLSSASLSRPSMQSVITWLKANYEEYPGCNTSRENLFSEYSQFAQSQGMMIMNSASFGKLIRAVFPTIQTRRLGVRGQSKYHYNGIRPKPSTGNKDYLIDMPVGGSHMSAAELSPSAISTAGAIGRLSNSGESLPFSAITSSKYNDAPRYSCSYL
jgi:hypothetical protein